MIQFGVQIKLDEPDSFLKVKETLTRIGVASNKNKTLYQTAHILHKRGEYYILHFKELFALDGKPSTLTEEDIERRNLIIFLLQDWGLITVLTPDAINKKALISSVKILSYQEKPEWSCLAKYQIGKKSNGYQT